MKPGPSRPSLATTARPSTLPVCGGYWPGASTNDVGRVRRREPGTRARCSARRRSACRRRRDRDRGDRAPRPRRRRVKPARSGTKTNRDTRTCWIATAIGMAISGMTGSGIAPGAPSRRSVPRSPGQLVADGDRDARSRRPAEPDDQAAQGGEAEPMHRDERDPPGTGIEEVVASAKS